MLLWQIIEVVPPDAIFSVFCHGTLAARCIGYDKK